MSAIQEIEEAIERLPTSERESLESRLIARRFGFGGETSVEYRELLSSLDEAERDIDAGRVVTAAALRKNLTGWTGQ